MVFLFRYVDTTNKKIASFLNSIKYSDFSISFSDNKLGKSFAQLNQSFNEVIKEFKKNRAAKEEQFHYLQTILQHINIGIISYSEMEILIW